MVFVFSARVAHAAGPTKDACVDADTGGQTLRLRGHLHEAIYDFRICASASCPSVVRDDCAKRIDEIARVMPSVFVSAVGASSSVTMDGATIASGVGVGVDPGSHRFVFTANGFEPIVRDVVVREGDPSVAVSATFTAKSAPPESAGSSLRVAGIVTGAVGVAALGFGTAFSVAAASAWSSAKSECASSATCQTTKAIADRSTAFDFATAADGAMIAGGALLAAGVVMFFVAPHRVRERAARITPMVDAKTLGIMLGAEF